MAVGKCNRAGWGQDGAAAGAKTAHVPRQSVVQSQAEAVLASGGEPG